MKGTIRLIKVAGIPVYLHWSFFLVFLVVGFFSFNIYEGSKFFFWFSALFLGVFMCVVLHEFGHALTARRYGVNTRDIILSPIGGIARLERLPDLPLQEFFIAIAGPLVNIGIAIFLLLFNFTIGIGSSAPAMGDMEAFLEYLLKGSFLDFFFLSLLWTNFSLALFNFIPAFPMDGGRILRSLLSIPLGKMKATLIATRIAQIIAIGMVIFSFYNGMFILSLISLFIFLAAPQELKVVKMEAVLEKEIAETLIIEQFTRLYKEDSFEKVVAIFKLGRERNFLVFEDEFSDEVVGVLPQAFIIDAIKSKYLEKAIGENMSNTFENIHPELNLKTLFRRMQEKGYSILPVLSEGKLLGKVDMDDLNRYLMQVEKMKSLK